MTEGLTTAVTSAFQKVSTDVMGLLALILPIGIAIFGAVWAIKWAKKFFSRMAS